MTSKVKRYLAKVKKPRYSISISGIFDEDIHNQVFEAINKYLSEKNLYDGITIFITSLGGEAHIGLACYELLKSLNTSIYTVAIGECTSSASILYSLGEKRFVAQGTICLIHTVSVSNGKEFCNSSDIEELRARTEKYNNIIKNIYLNAPNVSQEFCKLINELFKEIKSETLTSEEMLKLNFATNEFKDISEVL